MLLRAVELVVLCGAASHSASMASSQACSRCCEMRFEEAVATTVSAFQQLAYYKDTSMHCTEPRRGIARALSNAAKLDACI